MSFDLLWFLNFDFDFLWLFKLDFDFLWFLFLDFFLLLDNCNWLLDSNGHDSGGSGLVLLLLDLGEFFLDELLVVHLGSLGEGSQVLGHRVWVLDILQHGLHFLVLVLLGGVVDVLHVALVISVNEALLVLGHDVLVQLNQAGSWWLRAVLSVSSLQRPGCSWHAWTIDAGWVTLVVNVVFFDDVVVVHFLQSLGLVHVCLHIRHIFVFLN